MHSRPQQESENPETKDRVFKRDGRIKSALRAMLCSSRFNNLIRTFLPIFGKPFADPQFPALLLLRCALLQKVVGINRHVPWPVHWSTQVKAVHLIDRGTHCPGLAPGCYLDGRNGIIIGANTWIGPGVKLISMNHEVTNYTQYVKAPPIVIGNNCWIASNAIILPGVELGDHTVVAAGAVVTKSFLGNDQLLAGVPAQKLKDIAPYSGAHRN